MDLCRGGKGCEEKSILDSHSNWIRSAVLRGVPSTASGLKRFKFSFWVVI